MDAQFGFEEHLTVEAGVGRRPYGRIWLLRGPGGSSVESVLRRLFDAARAAGVPANASVAFTDVARAVLSEVFKEER